MTIVLGLIAPVHGIDDMMGLSVDNPQKIYPGDTIVIIRDSIQLFAVDYHDNHSQRPYE